MFLTKKRLTFLILFVLINTVKSDFFKVINENEKTNFDLSEAVYFIIESEHANDVLIFGCSSLFLNHFNQITEKWRLNTTLEVLNAERSYIIQKKIPKFVFVLMLIDQEFSPVMQVFIESVNPFVEMLSLVKLSSIMWTNKILNFIILHDCKITEMDVYSYFPFANNKCREFSEQNIQQMGTFYFHTSSKISFKSKTTFNTTPPNYLQFFPNKVPLNLNNCEIIVSTALWPPNVIDVNSNEPGIEMELILTLGQQLNASISFVEDPNSWPGLSVDENKEHTGRLGLLKKEVFDLTLGGMPAHVNIFREFDTSECYLPNALTFIVPRAGIFPSSMILWTMLEKHVKLFLLIVSVVLIISLIINLMIKITLAWKMSLNAKLGSKKNESFLQCTFTTVSILLRSIIETSKPTFPQNRSIQWIYGMWFAACLIINCYFNTTLTSFFTEPGRTTQLQTVDDIIDSNIDIAIDELYPPILKVDHFQKKYFLSKYTKSSVLAGLKLAAMGKAATFTDRSRAQHIAAQWVSGNGESSIYYITRGRINYWLNIIFYRGNVFHDRINDLVNRYIQSGYFEFQERKYYNRRLVRIMVWQYLMVYNSDNGISNTLLMQKLNKDFSDTRDSSMVGMGNLTEQSMFETNEDEIIQRFIRTDRTLVTWDHLSTVFQLWAIGMAIAGIVLICERFTYYLKID